MTAQLLPAKQLWLPGLTTGQPRPPAQRSLLVATPPPAIASSSNRLTAAAHSAQGTIQDSALLEKLAEAAKRAAEAGAQVVHEALDKPINISYKGVTDLVTDTDKASEEAILGILKQQFPRHAFLGEEGGVSGNTSSEYLWAVDPLDGTTNFSHGYPSFGVSVAVVRRGQPVAAAVVEFGGGPYAWVTRTFTACEGEGAFCNGHRISVSDVEDVTRSLLVTGFGYEHDEPWQENMALFQHFTDRSQGVRRLGAAAIDMCHIAIGVADAFWEYRLKPWDVSAGALLVKEAGGRVTTMAGEPYSVFSRSVLVSNGHLHEAVLEQTAPKTAALQKGGVDLSPWYIPSSYEFDEV